MVAGKAASGAKAAATKTWAIGVAAGVALLALLVVATLAAVSYRRRSQQCACSAADCTCSARVQDVQAVIGTSCCWYCCALSDSSGAHYTADAQHPKPPLFSR